MIPKKKEDGKYLVCTKCGYTKKVKKAEGYKTKEDVSEDKKLRVSVFDITPTSAEVSEERQQLREEYYEVFLETMAEEESSE